ncbi:MAG: hypothetical protein ACTHW4_12065 [Actinomycetales bacterium]
MRLLHALTRAAARDVLRSCPTAELAPRA